MYIFGFAWFPQKMHTIASGLVIVNKQWTFFSANSLLLLFGRSFFLMMTLLLLLLVRFNREKRDFPAQHVAAKKQKKKLCERTKESSVIGSKKLQYTAFNPLTITTLYNLSSCASRYYKLFVAYFSSFYECTALLVRPPICHLLQRHRQPVSQWLCDSQMNGGKCIMITHLYKRNGCGFAVFHLVFFSSDDDKISGATFKWPTFGAVFIFPFKWILFQLAYVEWFH